MKRKRRRPACPRSVSYTHLEGINFLFERLMSPELGDTAYGDGQRLICGAPGEYTGTIGRAHV